MVKLPGYISSAFDSTGRKLACYEDGSITDSFGGIITRCALSHNEARLSTAEQAIELRDLLLLASREETPNVVAAFKRILRMRCCPLTPRTRETWVWRILSGSRPQPRKHGVIHWIKEKTNA